MGPALHAGRPGRFGILVHRSSLWVSELVALTLTAAFIVSLSVISVVIFRNYTKIKANDRHIATLRAAQIDLDYSTARLRQEAKVLTLMRQLAGTRVPDQALCRIAGIVYTNSTQFGYDPLLLLAVIRVESVFHPQAAGRFRSGAFSGAFGLMQLKFETAAEIAMLLNRPPLSEKDLMDPEINLVLGVAYLTRLIKQFKSFKLGLLAYNQGPTFIYQTLAHNEPLSMEYYQNVLKSYFSLQKMANSLGG